MLKIASIFAYIGYIHVTTVRKAEGFISLLNYPKAIQKQIPRFEMSAFFQFCKHIFRNTQKLRCIFQFQSRLILIVLILPAAFR
jgi:hypothetical protein